MVQQTYVDPPHSLSDRVHVALARNPYVVQRTVRFEVAEDAEVVLRGTVASYYQKQMAQESLRSIDGIRRVRNELEVAAR